MLGHKSHNLPHPKYYILLRPREQNEWFKFYDETVTRIDLDKAFKRNFGDAGETGYTPNRKPRPLPYLLVYLRVSELNSLLDT
jgi:hypothetical protein